ncbi:hypothetical protein GRF59_27555 [Paenibacillus sp. HJL G12]|uniref:Uncharacterized protein n=1 Tax=Paenibacillus dendrobii TaxID=2691084 RepID=A0A7X3ISE8_9BACL|nr:hypothetical protein [Paenibacillus dendrobii]MWV47357.1 hypothetical protein [Paenibacillus dendrobii]
MIRRKALYVAIAALLTVVAVLSMKLSVIFLVSQEVVIGVDMAAALVLFIVIVRKIRRDGWAVRRNQ